MQRSLNVHKSYESAVLYEQDESDIQFPYTENKYKMFFQFTE